MRGQTYVKWLGMAAVLVLALWTGTADYAQLAQDKGVEAARFTVGNPPKETVRLKIWATLPKDTKIEVTIGPNKITFTWTDEAVHQGFLDTGHLEITGAEVLAKVLYDKTPNECRISINQVPQGSYKVFCSYCAIRGQVVDATTNRPLASALVTLSPLGRRTSADAEGRFAFTELPPGSYSVQAEASGFSRNSREVNCPAGETVPVVLALSPLGKWRIVLSWGKDPEDLDSHLWTPDGEHIWYGHEKGKNADLDVDDINGYGPETITIHKLVEGTYVYAVKHFDGSGTLASSGAKVDLFSPTTLMRSFTNPPCTTGKGSWWVVFKLHVRPSGVEIESVNKCLSSFDEKSPTPP